MVLTHLYSNQVAKVKEALTEKQANQIIKDFERDGRIHIEEFLEGMLKREV